MGAVETIKEKLEEPVEKLSVLIEKYEVIREKRSYIQKRLEKIRELKRILREELINNCLELHFSLCYIKVNFISLLQKLNKQHLNYVNSSSSHIKDTVYPRN